VHDRTTITNESTLILTQDFKKLLAQKAADGSLAAHAVTFTKIDDYYERLRSEFPNFSDEAFKKILTYGFRLMAVLVRKHISINAYNHHGHDGVGFLGQIPGNYEYFWNDFFYRKLEQKWRMWRAIHKKDYVWDGYYYVGFTEEEYNKYFKDKNSRAARTDVLPKICTYMYLGHVCGIPRYKYFYKFSIKEFPNVLLYWHENLPTRNLIFVGRKVGR